MFFISILLSFYIYMLFFYFGFFIICSYNKCSLFFLPHLFSFNKIRKDVTFPPRGRLRCTGCILSGWPALLILSGMFEVDSEHEAGIRAMLWLMALAEEHRQVIAGYLPESRTTKIFKNNMVTPELLAWVRRCPLSAIHYCNLNWFEYWEGHMPGLLRKCWMQILFQVSKT